jgi:Domain of unknown function (DUF4153)
MFLSRLDRLVPDLFETLRRFPVAVLAALGLCIFMNIFVVRHNNVQQWNIVWAFVAAFMAGGAGHLFAEGLKLPQVRGLAIALVAGLAAAALMYFNVALHSSELFLFGGLILLLMIAPFFNRSVGQGAVWLFNLRLGLAIILAILVGLVFGAGLSAVLAGLDFLLGIKIESEIYERVWVLATTVVGPIYGLSLVPHNLTEEIDLSAHQGSLMERGVSVLVNYVMVPLALLYALILHAYAIKIIVNGSLPKGQIGLIVSLFAIGGTATWLVGWPWRETGTKLLRLFMRARFWLLPVPAVLLAIAIWRRVSDYGVTPDRYAIAIVAVWTALAFVYLVLRRNRADMRVILGSAAVLLLVGSFGPQGAYGTTGASQFARLKSFLEAKGVLKDGKVVVKVPQMGQDDRINVETMVYALNAVNELEPLRHWFKDSDFSSPGFEWNQWSIGQLLAGNDSEVTQNSFAFTPELPVDHAWSVKTRLIGPLNILNYYEQKSAPKLISPAGVSAWLNDVGLRFSVDGKDAGISSEALIKALNISVKIESSKAVIAVVDVNPQFSLMVSQAFGHTGTKTNLSNMTFWIVQHE